MTERADLFPLSGFSVTSLGVILRVVLFVLSVIVFIS